MSVPGERESDGSWSYLNQSQIRNHGLDLLDDFWFGTCVERFKFHVEDRLFFWFLLGWECRVHHLARPKGIIGVPPQQAQQQQQQPAQQ